ncbi:MAG: exodeoxyribonuclease VII small subunit, partial [Oscillospiraceae bacterium]|nr:exodeoxyribonuclease VII small subunit [Oscillospiraceae bacterium]
LEESLTLFEEGTALIKKCSKQLDEAEQKVAVLKKGPDDVPEEVPFDAD